jgi:hypothetical protein
VHAFAPAVALRARRLEEPRNGEAAGHPARDCSPRPAATEILRIAEKRLTTRALQVLTEMRDPVRCLLGQIRRTRTALRSQMLGDSEEVVSRLAGAGAEITRSLLNLVACPGARLVHERRRSLL